LPTLIPPLSLLDALPILVLRLRRLQQAPAQRAPHLDERLQRLARPPRVDLGAVARDDPGLLEPPHPFGHRRRRQVDPPAELLERDRKSTRLTPVTWPSRM